MSVVYDIRVNVWRCIQTVDMQESGTTSRVPIQEHMFVKPLKVSCAYYWSVDWSN